MPGAALEVGILGIDMVSPMWTHTLRKRETPNKYRNDQERVQDRDKCSE